jgi:hypothetical protein
VLGANANLTTGPRGRHLQRPHSQQEIPWQRPGAATLPSRTRKVQALSEPHRQVQPHAGILNERAHKNIRRPLTRQTSPFRAVQIRIHHAPTQRGNGALQENLHCLPRSRLWCCAGPKVLQRDARHSRQPAQEHRHLRQQPPVRRRATPQSDRKRQDQQRLGTGRPRTREASPVDGATVHRARPISLTTTSSSTTTTTTPTSCQDNISSSLRHKIPIPSLPQCYSSCRRPSPLPIPSPILAIRCTTRLHSRLLLHDAATLPTRRRHSPLLGLQPHGLPVPNPRIPASQHRRVSSILPEPPPRHIQHAGPLILIPRRIPRDNPVWNTSPTTPLAYTAVHARRLHPASAAASSARNAVSDVDGSVPLWTGRVCAGTGVWGGSASSQTVSLAIAVTTAAAAGWKWR